MKLARRLNAIKPSPTLALNTRAKVLAAAGEDVVGFAAGEPDFDTPVHIKQAAVQALDDGFTKYTATAGTPELRAAICEKLKADNGLSYREDSLTGSYRQTIRGLRAGALAATQPSLVMAQAGQ